MRAIVIFILSCVSVIGTDTGVSVVTTARTNARTASISTKDVFIRDGQTNLVRNTATKTGTVQIRIHRFYRGGSLVGNLIETPNSSLTTSEPESPFGLGFEYGASRQLKHVVIISPGGIVVDAFAGTNGVLTPVPSSKLSNVAEVGEAAKKLISNAPNMSPKQFKREVNRILEKHDK